MASATSESGVIPIVDISQARNGSLEERDKAAQGIADACRRVGFVYITGHGVDPGTLEAAFTMSKKLFELPIEDKMKAPHPSGGAVHRGYSYPGLEKVSQETDTDVEVVAALRKIQDVKVCGLSHILLIT
jgi:isopenicillin N synthase-like dioxygenase